MEIDFLSMIKLKMIENAYAARNFKMAEVLLKSFEKERPPIETLAKIKDMLANVYLATQNYTDAVEALLEALSLYRKLESKNPTEYKLLEIDALLKIGQVFLQIENEKASEKYLSAAVIALETAGPEVRVHPEYRPYLGVAYLSLGAHYKVFHRNLVANEYLEKAMEILRSVSSPDILPLVNRLHNFIAEIDIIHGEYDSAMRHLEEVFRTASPDSIEYARAIMNYGWIMLKRDALSLAERYLLEAEARLRNMEIPILFLTAQRLLALTYLKQDNVLDAADKIISMIDTLTEVAKSSRGMNLFYRLGKYVNMLHEAVFFINKAVLRGDERYLKQLSYKLTTITEKLNKLWETISSLPLTPDVEMEQKLKYVINLFKKLDIRVKNMTREID